MEELDSTMPGSACSAELDCSTGVVSEDVSTELSLESGGLSGVFVESDTVADEPGTGSTFSELGEELLSLPQAKNTEIDAAVM
jgi:hypothetical protein